MLRALLLVLGRFLVAVLLVVAAGAPALAAEVVRSFDVTVEMTDRDLIRVTERITVVAEGSEIRRGIFRDIPLTSVDDDGTRREATFRLLSVERDGQSEPYSSERNGRGVRIVIGDKDVFLDYGPHTYVITYETGRQIRRFDDHDELYWNVTGNEWRFPILSVQAEVILPPGTRPTMTAAFTGAFGESGEDFTSTISPDGSRVTFRTTRRLEVAEGLTVAVAVPKGVIQGPSGVEGLWYTALDHRDEVIGSLGVGLVLLYYLWAWTKVGRDPPAGVIIPLFSAPPGVSPALAHYVEERGLKGGGWTALSAAVVDLAVKGYLTIEDIGDETRLERTSKMPAADLSKAEARIVAFLSGKGGALTLSKEGGKRVMALGRQFSAEIVSENRGKYFQTNRGYAILGVILSVVALAALFAFGRVGPEEIALFAPLAMGGVFSSIAVVRIVSIWQLGTGLLKRLATSAFFAVFAFVGIAAIGGALVAFFEGDVNVWLAITGAALVVVNGLFFILLAAPTAAGRPVMDAVEGLKLYLSVAEAERMNMPGAPLMSPNHYETLLPYAIALGVEKPWSRAFEGWLTTAAAAASAADYQPSWYHGRPFERGRFADRITSTVGGLSSSFASSLPETRSSGSAFSSGGGGGRSGGGGGGGGGGGW